jgi:hypothetical protein
MRRELLDRLKNEKYESDIRDYLTELIYLKYSPFRYTQYLDRLELTPLERKILQYNLTVKAINAVGDNLPEDSRMRVNKYDRFSIEVGFNSEWEIINMIFDDNIKISYYDRTTLLKDIFDLSNELDELEEEYHHNYSVYYNHLDDTKEEVKMKLRIEDLKNKLYDLSVMKEDKKLFVLDEIVRNELKLPSENFKKVYIDELYDTYNVTNNKSIKVYKKVIGK